MKWTPIKDCNDLPKDDSVFLIVWLDRVCLAQWGTVNDLYVCDYPVSFNPAYQLDESVWDLITHWMPLPELSRE